eukprot:4029960-Alexandrium_andersonii.AAC.1
MPLLSEGRAKPAERLLPPDEEQGASNAMLGMLRGPAQARAKRGLTSPEEVAHLVEQRSRETT